MLPRCSILDSLFYVDKWVNKEGIKAKYILLIFGYQNGCHVWHLVKNNALSYEIYRIWFTMNN